MGPLTIHLIANAHLDPVWLWDWREGLNEGIATCRTVLELLDEFPELTFTRGEAAIYQHIAQHDPPTFRRIKKQVQAGRWEVVGGTWVQPDTNLPATETLVRHFTRGVRYFEENFGKRVSVSWQADSFGHAAGLPEILQAAGMDSFAFTRPQPGQLDLKEPAFWWEGASGARVLAYRPAVGWYGTERDEVPRRLDALVAHAGKSKLRNIAGFFGLGNHGGGPTRRQLLDIRTWAAAHPAVRVIFSGLHRFFAALRRERAVIPTHRGELNFCLRGCYASVARFKYAYRKTEALLARAERSDAIIRAALHRPPASLRTEWDGVLFNSFHDILPGSSIERACDEQVEWLGGILHRSRQVEFAAVNALAHRVDTRVAPVNGDQPSGVPVFVWNPQPVPFAGHVEIEASLDYRPLWQYRDRPGDVPVRVLAAHEPIPFQLIPTEHSAMPQWPWRMRAVVPVEIPAWGWTVLELGLAETKRTEDRPAVVLPVLAAIGADTIQLWDAWQLSAITVEDPYGAWGSMSEEPASLDLSTVRHHWQIANIETVEHGPERTSLWTQWVAGNSRLELVFSQTRGRPALDVAARVLWNERSARLKLVFHGVGATAEFDVPGGSVVRGPLGEVPGGRWVRAGKFGFASDVLYNFNLKDGALHATIARASRYANDVTPTATEAPVLPVTDTGELKFRFLLTRDGAQLARLARELEQPPVIVNVPAKLGPLPRTGSLGELWPASLKLLALKPAEDGRGFILRVQAAPGANVKARLRWLGKTLTLGTVRGGAIVSWRLQGPRAVRGMNE